MAKHRSLYSQYADPRRIDSCFPRRRRLERADGADEKLRWRKALRHEYYYWIVDVEGRKALLMPKVRGEGSYLGAPFSPTGAHVLISDTDSRSTANYSILPQSDGPLKATSLGWDTSIFRRWNTMPSAPTKCVSTCGCWIQSHARRSRPQTPVGIIVGIEG